jgi:hypothetical protein
MALLLFRLVLWKPACAENRLLTDMTGKLLMVMTSLGVGTQWWVPME